MKKQFMKPALFVAALAAVSLTSCEQKNEISGVPGETTDIAVGMSLALPVETKAATTPDDVNFGASVADIKNVTIVPMVGTTLQNAIVLGTFDADVQTTHYKTKEVLKTVDGFRVYGNMPSAADENKAFNMPSLAKGDAADNLDASVTGLKEPHSLYYYTEATVSGPNKFQVANGTTAGDWTSVQFNDATAAVGDFNRIKIKGVTYAVGVFSAAVHDEVTGEFASKQIFYDASTPDTKKSWDDVKGESKAMKITGIIIEGQSADFDETFTPTGGEVDVFSKANNETLATADISFDDENKVANANIYTIVAPEADETLVKFQFQNTTGYTFELNNGTTVAPNAYFYLAATLSPDGSNKVFDAKTSTLINARVLDWGKATLTPPESVEAEIGIEIDVEWKKGIAYDVEI